MYTYMVSTPTKSFTFSTYPMDVLMLLTQSCIL